MLAHVGYYSLTLGTEPWTWTFDPLQVGAVLLVGFAYARRVRSLRQRGHGVAAARRVSFYIGLTIILAAFVSPVDPLGETRLLSAHMIQHIMIGEIGALFVVAGLTGPVLRPVLALPYVGRLRVLAHPLVALPIWGLTLYLWHLPVLYEAAIEHDAVHAFQHGSFFLAGAVMWAALLEPLPGPVWFGAGAKAAYVAVVRFSEAILANVFVWSSQPFYTPYVEAERLWGLTPVKDQNIGGGVMMVTGTILTLTAFAWVFLRWAREGERTQQLIEEGVNPLAAARAARFGR